MAICYRYDEHCLYTLCSKRIFEFPRRLDTHFMARTTQYNTYKDQLMVICSSQSATF